MFVHSNFSRPHVQHMLPQNEKATTLLSPQIFASSAFPAEPNYPKNWFESDWAMLFELLRIHAIQNHIVVHQIPPHAMIDCTQSMHISRSHEYVQTFMNVLTINTTCCASIWSVWKFPRNILYMYTLTNLRTRTPFNVHIHFRGCMSTKSWNVTKMKLIRFAGFDDERFASSNVGIILSFH